MWANVFNESNFAELRPGVFEELQGILEEMSMLQKHYENELGPERVKQIREEVKAKLEQGLKPGVSASSSGTSFYLCHEEVSTTVEPATPCSSSSYSRSSTRPAPKGLLAELLSRKEDSNYCPQTSSAPSSWTVTVTQSTSNVTKKMSASVGKDPKDSETTEESEAAKLKTSAELLSSQWAERLMRHRRGADSRDVLGPTYNCICGYNSNAKYILESHLRREIFGKVFKCENCGFSFAHFPWYKSHCMRLHRVKIANHTACTICGAQFKVHMDLVRHNYVCPGKVVLEAAMRIQLPLPEFEPFRRQVVIEFERNKKKK